MAQVADAATAEATANAKEEKKDEQFRRYSAACGYETDVVPKRQIKATAASEAEMDQDVLDYLKFVKNSKNIKVVASEYYKENFHREDDPDLELAEMKRFLEKLTIAIKPVLKFAKWGATARISFIVVMIYSDIVTDIVVIKEFYNLGRLKAMRRCIGIMIAANTFHVILSLIKNSRRGMSAQLLGAMIAL